VDNARRLQYLQAMGIDVWVPRASRVSDLTLVHELQDEIATTKHVEAQAQAQVIDIESCALCDSQTQGLSGIGNQQTEWLFFVEVVNSDDDSPNRLFEKNAGLLLAEMLRAIDLSVEEVFIAPLIACKAFDQPDSPEFCSGYLMSQQQLIQPKIIVAVGDKAAQALLKTKQTLASLRGRCHYFNKIPVVVVEHPAYLLRSLLEKRDAWQDLCFAKQIFNKER